MIITVVYEGVSYEFTDAGKLAEAWGLSVEELNEAGMKKWIDTTIMNHLAMIADNIVHPIEQPVRVTVRDYDVDRDVYAENDDSYTMPPKEKTTWTSRTKQLANWFRSSLSSGTR